MIKIMTRKLQPEEVEEYSPDMFDNDSLIDEMSIDDEYLLISNAIIRDLEEDDLGPAWQLSILNKVFWLECVSCHEQYCPPFLNSDQLGIGYGLCEKCAGAHPGRDWHTLCHVCGVPKEYHHGRDCSQFDNSVFDVTLCPKCHKPSEYHSEEWECLAD